MSFKTGDQVTIKPTVDPNDKRIGTICWNVAGDAQVSVNWGNEGCLSGNCERHYIANLELYVRPFAVGDKVDVDNGYKQGTIVYVQPAWSPASSHKTEYVINCDSFGIIIRQAKSLKHAN